MFKNMKVYNKLMLIFILIIIVPMNISFYLAFKTSEKLIIEQYNKETKNSIVILKKEVERFLERVTEGILGLDNKESVKELLYYLEKEENNTTNNEEKYRLIKAIEEDLSTIRLNIIKSKSYIALISNNHKKYTNYYINNSYEYSKHIEHWEQIFSEKENPIQYITWMGIEDNYVDYERDLYPYVLTFGKKISDNYSKKVYGYIIISISEETISELLELPQEHSDRMIIDQNQRIIVASDDKLIGKNLMDIYQIDLLKTEKDTIVIDSKRHGKSILSYDKIDRTPWYIVNIRSFSEMNERISNIRNQLFIFNWIAMIVFLLMALLIAKKITDPIHELSIKMEELNFEDDKENLISQNSNEVRALENSFNVMKIKLKILMEENKEKEKNKRLAEIRALQAQINPHFLFNTLNTIRWAAINNKNQKVSEMILLLVRLLKSTIVKEGELKTIREEVEIVETYIRIFAMRNSKNINVSYKISQECLEIKIPTLLIQPIVENAIFHGLGEKKEEGQIEINISKENSRITITIRDNGKGMNPECISTYDLNKKDHKGIGIGNVKERIKLYYGDKGDIKITSAPNMGTEVTLTIHELGEREVEK